MSYEEAKDVTRPSALTLARRLKKLKKVPVSLHCWQGDDVRGFDTDPSKPADRRHPDHG